LHYPTAGGNLRRLLPPVVLSEFIYEKAPFPACHASTIAEVRPGELVAAWFGGTAESAPDVCIYLSHRGPRGWSKPTKVADGQSPDGHTYACYNPVLFQPRAGPLWLFYKVGRGPQTWWGMCTRSSDGGLSWGKPIRLPDGIFGPIKNKPVELADGTILCGSSEEQGGWRVHIEQTKDPAGAWTRTPGVNDPGVISAIQPSILPMGGRRLRAVGRTRQGKLFFIDSPDDGRTWGSMRLSNVPNPNSGTDAVRLKDGRFLLVFNDSPRERTPLCVALASDAEHWHTVLTLENGPGEYSYPAIIQTADGLVHITYTWRRTRIRHVVVDVSKLDANQTSHFELRSHFRMARVAPRGLGSSSNGVPLPNGPNNTLITAPLSNASWRDAEQLASSR
jgi:predicted neuraminidase